MGFHELPWQGQNGRYAICPSIYPGAVARKFAMVDGRWRFEKKVNIRPCFASFSLPWKH